MGYDIAEESIKQLNTIKDGLSQDRQSKETTWADIAAYINPAMQDPGTYGDPVKGRSSPDTGKYRYDNTAPNASSLSADGIEGYAFGRQNPWFKLNLEDEDPSIKSNQRYLQDVEKQLYRQLNRSPFYDEGRLYVRSLLDFGTAIMMRSENVASGIPIYRTLNLFKCYIADNSYGDVDTLIRDFYLTPQEAVSEYGYDRVPQTVKNQYDQNDTTRSMYTEFIFPNGRYNIDIKRTGKPYISIHIANCGHVTDLRVDGYESRPFFCSRFTRPYEGAWGEDSPGMLQLSNIKELNEAIKNRRKISQRRASPPIKATEGMYGRIKNKPDGVTYVPAGNDFAYMNNNAGLQELDQDISDWRKMINDAYHTDFFLILTQNVDKMKTATEAQGIQGEKAAILAAFFGRMGYEFHEPLLEDLFSMEVANGRIPPRPKHLAGKPVKIDYISPLYTMQRQYLMLNSTKQALNEILTIAKMQAELGQTPAAMDNIDFDKYVKHIVDAYNMNERIVRDELDIQKIRQGRMQQQQALAQMEQAKFKADMENDRMKALADVKKAGGGMNLA